CRGNLMQEVIRGRRIYLKGVSKPHLLRWNTRDLREPFVDELRGHDGMLSFEGIGGRQVVILAGIDDDASGSINASRKKLINKGAFEIDIAKNDAIEGVVEHHIKPLESTHRSNFWHTEARAVVRQADIASNLPTRLIKRIAHQLKIGLGGIGSTE